MISCAGNFRTSHVGQSRSGPVENDTVSSERNVLAVDGRTPGKRQTARVLQNSVYVAEQRDQPSGHLSGHDWLEKGSFLTVTFTRPAWTAETIDPIYSFWLQGVAFVNGVNIGRYWTSAGPQITLYVPAVYLIPAPGVNTVVMLELEGVPQDLSIGLVDKPTFRGLPYAPYV